MKVLIVYDSVYGNTEQIARAIGGGITNDVKVLHAKDVEISELKGLAYLSPVRRHRVADLHR